MLQIISMMMRNRAESQLRVSMTSRKYLDVLCTRLHLNLVQAADMAVEALRKVPDQQLIALMERTSKNASDRSAAK